MGTPGRTALFAAAAAAAAAAIAAAVLAYAFHADLRDQRARIATGSQLVATRCGAIEVALAGDAAGPPLLVIHGTGGGFDQGLAIGADYAARGWRVIAPSRFGYLRTPLPADASPHNQADHFACLLDVLGVPDAAVLGASAGAISATQFAIRHPQRTRGLVLLVPAMWRPDPAPAMPRWAERALDTVLAADFPFWLAARIAPDTMRSLVLATPRAAYDAASADDRRRADTLLREILPITERRAGLRNDARVTPRVARFDLEAIRVPTIAISAKDDAFDTYAAARYTAAQIADARFLGFERGGHLLLGHRDEVADAVDAMLPR